MKNINYFKFLLIILMLAFMTGCSPITTPSEKADLIVTDIFEVPTEDIIYYTIENQGTATASETTSFLYINGEYKAFDLVGSLDVGESRTESFWTFTYNWPEDCTGASDTVVIQADVENEVVEDNESNNTYMEEWPCYLIIVI